MVTNILKTLAQLEIDIDRLHDADCGVSYDEIERAVRLIRDVQMILED